MAKKNAPDFTLCLACCTGWLPLAVAHSLLAKYTATPVEGCMEALKTAARFATRCKDDCLLFGFGIEMLLYSNCSQTVIGLVFTALLPSFKEAQ